MSRTNTEKTVEEQYMELFEEFRRQQGGGVRAKDVAEWIDAQGKLPKPTVDAVTVHTRKLKQAIRKKRIRDLRGRQIQPIVAIKVEKMTSGGQTTFEFVYDYLHEMTLDHALAHFNQKDDNITKQKKASTRNLQSCLDFNPNVQGHEDEFNYFDFVVQDASVAEVVEEVIEESEANSPYASDTVEGIAKQRQGRDATQPR